MLGVKNSRTSQVCLIAIAAITSALAQQPARGIAVSKFSPTPWLEDFHQLLREMSSHYANLDWAIEERRMDLPKLRVDTEAALNLAHDPTEARAVFDHFVAAFADGHLELDWPQTDSGPLPAFDHASLCERLGYKRRGKASIDFSLLRQFSELPAEEGTLFPGGLLRLSSGKTFGVIRIGVFSEKAYPEACQQAEPALGLADNANCDDACGEKIAIRAGDVLTAALTVRAEKLRHAGATALLVDITGNGGGSDWVEAPPRALSSKRLRAPRLGFIRHAHWRAQLEEQLQNVETDLNHHREPEPTLRDAAATLRKAIAATKQPCDREQVWITAKENCSLVVSDALYASGVLAYAPPGGFAGLKSQTALFHPSQYAYTEAGDRLPLYVVVDGNTWSAAEYFAALLQDNQAATIIGQLTGGAGCGYTNGGIPVELINSKAAVRMPDCVRLRVDGSNEVNGVTPDILIPWARRDSPYQRASKLLSALQSLP
jgi:hypothetical protein